MPEQAFVRQAPIPEPTRDPTTRAIKRYWYVLLACCVLCAGCGAAYAFNRSPIYTASARLSALSVNATNPASLAGSLQAAQELVSTYGRVVQTTQITRPVAATLHTTQAWVLAHVTATPVPTSPFVRIDATAASPRLAIRAANLALKALTVYGRKLTDLTSAEPAMIRSIRANAARLSHAQDQVAHLKTLAHNNPDPAQQNAIASAVAQVQQVQTQLNGAQLAYTQLTGMQSSSRQAIAVSRALGASSDRSQVAQIAILLALLVGVVVGVAAATALAARAARRTRKWQVG